MKIVPLFLALASLGSASNDSVLAAGLITANYDNLKTADGPLGLGVKYANITNPYRRLNYSSAYVINLLGDVLTDLEPPSPPNVLACPNKELNSIACGIRVGTSSAYGFVLKGFKFACATELGIQAIPEAVGCEIRISCATAAGVQTGIDHSATAGYDGGVDFQSFETPQFDDLDFYRCYFSVASASFPDNPLPFVGNVTLLVDNLQYTYRKA